MLVLYYYDKYYLQREKKMWNMILIASLYKCYNTYRNLKIMLVLYYYDKYYSQRDKKMWKMILKA